MVMNEAASAPVVSATSSETPTLLERASGRRRTARRTRRRSLRLSRGRWARRPCFLPARGRARACAELLLRASKGVAMWPRPAVRRPRRGCAGGAPTQYVPYAR